MNEVPEDFAIAEGEGERTYQDWKEIHKKFFTEELRKAGLEFSERFKLVDVKNK